MKEDAQRVFDALSEEQKKEIQARYYNGTKAQALVEEFHIPISGSSLYTLFPDRTYPNRPCPYCHIPMVSKAFSRTHLQSRFVSRSIKCPICGHFNKADCQCQNCIEKRRKEIDDKKSLLRLNFARPERQIALDDISFTDRISLAAMCRLHMSEDMTRIEPIRYLDSTRYNNNTVFFHDTKNIADVIRHFKDEEIIYVDPESEISAFTFDDDESVSYYLSEVCWLLNIKSDEEADRPLMERLVPTLTEDNLDEVLKLWIEIATAECIDFMQIQLSKIRLNAPNGAQTRELIRSLLWTYSEGQIFNLIYRQIDKIARYLQENRGIPRQQAANTIVSRLRGYAERAQANNWEIKPFTLPYEQKESEAAKILFNGVIKLGDERLKIKPSVEVIRNALHA